MFQRVNRCCAMHRDVMLERISSRPPAWFPTRAAPTYTSPMSQRSTRRGGLGGLPVSDVEDKEWGMRKFTVADPGGNTIRVGQNI